MSSVLVPSEQMCKDLSVGMTDDEIGDVPIKARFNPPTLRLSITIRPAPISSARCTIASSRRSPILRWAIVTVQSASSMLYSPECVEGEFSEAHIQDSA